MSEEPIQKVEQLKKEETTSSKPYYDVVNVSESFQLRTAYKKKVKPSKLDGLLERRVKQFTLEEKQRLERMRQAALQLKLSGTKPPSSVKTEGSTLVKPQNAVTPCVKVEEKEEGFHVKDHVVKKLNFEQEKTEVKPDNMDVKPDTTAPNNSKQTEVNPMQGSGGDAPAHKEVNGGPLANTELNSKNNCITEVIDKEKTQKPEVARVGDNAKKRGYEDVEQGSGQNNTESTEVDQTKNSPVQVNGDTAATAAANSNSVQGDIKEPLVNGNLSQNDGHPPPLKVPKLENHVAEKGDSLSTDKAPSSSPSCVNSNSTDNCSGSEGVKSSTQGAVTTNTTDTSKAAVTSQAASSAVSSTTTSTSSSTPPSSLAPGPAVSQKAKPITAGDAKTSSTTTSSMTISKEYSTRDRVSLLRFSKSKKARSGTALPSYRKFVTKSSKKSIFILPNDDLKRLARRAGIREVPIFNYNAKPATDIWPYPSPRPTFGITWRSVTI